MNPEDAKELEIIPPSAVEAMTRAEVDVAIATAHRFPREIAKVKQNMLAIATLDQETAEACFYALPRGGKTIEGPSVRLAEIAVSSYGNLSAGSRIIAVVAHGEAPHVVVQAVAKDLEKNITISVEKRRRIVKKRSKDSIDEDDINLAANACSAICFRDAVFKVVPLAIIKPVFEAARKVAIGDQRTLSDRRTKCFDTFAKMGVTKERVLARMEVKTIEEINLDHLQTLLGLHNAIKEGEVNLDEAFPGTAATPRPEPTAFQQSQGAKTYQLQPATAPAPAEPPPKQTAAASTPTPAPEPTAAPKEAEQPAKRGPGRPRKMEKLTQKEAAEIVASGVAVDPNAVEGGWPPAKPAEPPPQPAPEPTSAPTSTEASEAELAAMGLAPEKPAEPTAAPAKAPFQPVPGEPQALTTLRKLMYDDDVSESQLMKFCAINKLSSGEVKLSDFVSNNRTVKIAQLCQAWPNKIFLEKVKATKE